MDTPILEIATDVNSGYAPLEVTFIDMTSPEGLTYEWNFGNGQTSNNIGSATTIYNDLGNYDFNLLVSYSDYCGASFSQNDFIQVGEVPIANFSFSPSGITNLNPDVQFENLSSSNVNTLL